MRKSLRWLITVAFYFSNVAVIGYCLLKHGSFSEFYLNSVILIECFSLLGLVTSDYLTPSLSYISSNIFHISNRVSGMTLLALGNALPDITSTYQSMKSGVTSLAIGELFGGIFFLLTVVIGLMGCVATIQFQHDKSVETYTEESFDQNLSYNRSHYVLDVGIFTFMLLVSGTFLADGRLFFWECIVMVLTYCCCAIYLVRSHNCPCDIGDASEEETKKTGFAERHLAVPNNPTLSTANDVSSTSEAARHMRSFEDTQINYGSVIDSGVTPLPNNSADNILRFNEGVTERRDLIRRRIRGYLRSNYHGWVRMTLQDCLNIWEKQSLFNNAVKSLSLPTNDTHSYTKASEDEDRPLIRKRINSLQPEDYYTYVSPISGRNSNPLDTAISAPQNEPRSECNEPVNLYLTVPQKQASRKSLSCDRIPSLVQNNGNAFDDVGEGGTCGQHSTNPMNSISDVVNESLLQCEGDDIILQRTLSLCSVNNGTVWQTFQLYNYLSDMSLDIGPSEFLSLLITTPVSIILYLLIPSEVSQKDHNSRLSYLQIIQLIASPVVINQLVIDNFSYWLFILSLIIAISLYFKLKTTPMKYNSDIIFTVAFLLSLACLSKTVHIVVVTLTHWIRVFNISETILGLTIFTWGNSIGDLVSNITFVRMGVLEIAIGACFGSPLLYFLFGVGFDGIMIMLGDRTGKIVNGRDSNILMHHIDFEVDKNLINTGVGILIAFFIFTVLIPLNGWKIDKKISIALLTLYVLTTIISVLLEVY